MPDERITVPSIDIDLSKPCTTCGAMGAAQNGLCLECIGDDVEHRALERGGAVKETEWRRMPEAEAIVDALVAQHHHHLESARIVVIGKPKASKSRGKVNVAKAKRATDALNAILRDEIGEVHYLIEIGLNAWNTYGGADRRRILDHELMHFAGLDDESGKWMLVGHDVEAFTSEVQRYGAWTPDLRLFCGAMKQLDLFGVSK